MSQEKLKILDMVQNKTITPQEGAELLKSLEEEPKQKSPKKEPFRMFKIRVNSHDGDKVNIQIPLEFARVALKSKKGLPKLNKIENMDVDLDLDMVLDMIEAGTVGKIVDVESSEGDIVEIVIE